METKIEQQKWYSKTPEETLKLLKTTAQGLTPEEAQSRLGLYGENKLPEPKRTTTLEIFLHQFRSPLIYILLIAALIVFLMQEYVDGATILVVLLINAVIGTFQEGKAQNTFEALKKLATSEATVLREDTPLIIPDIQVVPGDIIILKEGEKIPADARLLSVSGLRINESSLTGESVPADKTVQAIPEKPSFPLPDQTNIVFKGTYAVSGSGTAVVVATAEHTAVGVISHALTEPSREIPLQRNINHLSRILIFIVLAISIILFAYGVSSGRSMRDMFGIVVSLAVSIIPEGLPVAITLVLARGVFRMSKRNALVKKLQAVESLGQTDIIAVDKTGTITKNELRVTQLILPGKTFSVTGSGFDPRGELVYKNKVVSPQDFPELKNALLVLALCPKATRSLDPKTNLWKISGDPTDAALLIAAEKAGVKKEALESAHPLVEEIPFDYIRKFHATVHKFKKGSFLSVIGAPEAILAGSALTKTEQGKIKTRYNKLAEQGLRVLGFGYALNPGSIENGLPKYSFGGLITLEDTLQESAGGAIEDLRQAGIRTVMITGDNKVTAQAIAEQAGIYQTRDIVVSGEEIGTLGRTDLSKVSVFARITPEHKMRIIQEFSKRDQTIAMTGDGVNDAPSLIAADLGIAMGVRGTEVAKEAADIVLLDDNFRSIVSAVEEGRSIYKTIKKVLLYLFSTSVGELGVVVVGIILGLPLPLLAVHIIWLNFVTDGFLTVALGLEAKENGLLEGKFRKPPRYLIDSTMIKQILIMGGTMTVVGIALFTQYHTFDSVKAQTVCLTALAVIQWFNAWNVRSESRSILATNPFSNPWLICATGIVVLLQVLAVYNPLLQKFLTTVPLSMFDWILIISLSLLVIVTEELRKLAHWITSRIHR